MALTFKNRYQAINYYKNEISKLDDEMQSWITHWEAKKNEKILNFTKRLTELNDLIVWNKRELKKESLEAEQ